MADLKPWTDVLRLRPEVTEADGGVGDLQMSLHSAVYQTATVPYRDAAYYGDITQPTPNLVGFFARVARRLSGATEATALYHLDQGMGGGKSHALVGLYHMAANPKTFFGTHIGKDVKAEAQVGGGKIEIDDVCVVTLTADHFSPGRATETFGPAVNLFERFLWSLFQGDRKKYDAAVKQGANKATIEQALASVGRPVLVLLDELMDYAMALSAGGIVETMPSEQAFLNALMDACDDIPRVAFVLVMIRTEFDRKGYTALAHEFREYLGARINRNGATIAVTETGDFSAIIRRRIFEQGSFAKEAAKLAAQYERAIAADPAWDAQVLKRLGSGKGVAALGDRIAETYPFHPDLMDLVQNEWGKTQGFQRVRSTVLIFALATLHWTSVAAEGGWVPTLIGVGDLPLGGIKNRGKLGQARCLEALLNSGLLLGNDRAIQGYRAVATTDVTSADGSTGLAVEIDRKLANAKVDAGQPGPVVRMATALFNFSLVARSQGRRGATKAELLAALLLPANGATSAFSSVEEVFTALVGGEGLGALEVSRSSNNQPERYWLTVKQTVRMFFTSAKNQVSDDQAADLVWGTAQELSSKGQFSSVHPIPKPVRSQTLGEVAGGFDSDENRLWVLNSDHWTLLNGEDSRSRDDVRRILGVGEGSLVVDSAASCVVAVVNTYQRRQALQVARDVLAWKLVSDQVIEGDERDKVSTELVKARDDLKDAIRKAYRHYAYILRKGDQLEVIFGRFEDDKQTALNGNDVWTALVQAGRAVGEYFDPIKKARQRKPLSDEYLAMLLSGFDRHLTLRDVVSSFYKNPRFPLVPGLDDIRNAIFKMLQVQTGSDLETGGWELVGSDGSPINVVSAKEIAINSSQQQIRRRQPKSGSAFEEGAGTGADGGANGDSTGGSAAEASGSGPSAAINGNGIETPGPSINATTDGVKTKADSYSWYSVEIPNRSIVDDGKREEVRSFLRWLAAQLDNDQFDHQLVRFKYEVMAGTNPTLAAEIQSRANGVDAKVQVRDEDA